MIRYAQLQVKDNNPFSEESSYHIRTAANAVVQEKKPGHRYYVVGGLHGDVPNGNGDFFNFEGELLRNMVGKAVYAGDEIDWDKYGGKPRFMYETWRGRGNYINHNSNPRGWMNKNRVGTIVDVYPDFTEKCIDFLLEVDESRAPWLVQAIDRGEVTDTSMGTYVNWSLCSHCGKICESEDQWCEHLKTRKGKRCPDGPNCKGRCWTEGGGRIFEDNRECSGLEDSWIIHGHGADPDAKHKYTVASMDGGDDMAGFKSVSRSSTAGVSANDIDQSLFAEEKRRAIAARNGGASNTTNDAMLKMAQALGADGLTKLGLDPGTFGFQVADAPEVHISDEELDTDIDQMIEAAEHEATIQEQAPAVIAQAKASRLASIDKQIAALDAQKSKISEAAAKTASGGKVLARINGTIASLVNERLAIANEDGGTDMEQRDVDRIAKAVVAQLAGGGNTVPSAANDQPTTLEHDVTNTDPAPRIKSEQAGKDYSAEMPMTGTEMGQVNEGDVTVPDASMKNPTEKENHPVNGDPASMIKPEQPGKDYSPTAPGMTTAQLADMIKAAVKEVLACGVPSESMGNTGDSKAYSASDSPDSMISGEKPGKNYSIEMPEVASESKSTDAAVPTVSTKSDESGDKEYGVNDNPESMISPEQAGRQHDAKPAVEAARKRPSCKKCDTPLVFGKCPKCDKKAKCAVKFVPDEEDFTRSAWLIDIDGNTKMRVAAANAYPTDTKANYEWFSSRGYADLLMQTINDRGFEVTASIVNAQMFDDMASGPKPTPGEKTPDAPGGGGSKPVTPDPEVSKDIMGGPDKDDLGVEDILIGVLSVVAADGQATVDEIKGVLEGLKDPANLDKFIGRLEQGINDAKEEDSDSKDALDGKDKSDDGGDKPPFGGPKKDGGDKPPFGGPKKDGGDKPPFGGPKKDGGDKPPFGGKQAPPFGGGPKKKPPFLGGGKEMGAQLKEPSEMDARKYFGEIFPPEFVEGLFAGNGKAVTSALNKMVEMNGTINTLKTERSKVIQAKRVDKVLESMARKGMLRTPEDIMADDKISYAEAVRRAEAEAYDKKVELLNKDDESFESFVEAVRMVQDRTDTQPGVREAKGLRMVPVIKNNGAPRVAMASLDEDDTADDGIWSAPPMVSEGSAVRRSDARKERMARRRTDEEDMVNDGSDEESITDLFTSSPDVEE